MCIKHSLVMSRFPFSVLFQINYALLWHHRFEQEEKKTKQTTKKTFCCVLAGEANSSKCSLIHYSQTKTALVLRSHMCSWNSQISSDRVGPDASHSQVKAGGNSDQPQVFLCIICTRCHGKCCLLVDARWPTLAPLCWCEPGSWIVTHQHGSSGSY